MTAATVRMLPDGAGTTNRTRLFVGASASAHIITALAFALVFTAFVGGVTYAQRPAEAPDVEVVTERMLFTRGPEGPLVLHMVQLVNVGPRAAERVPLPVPQGAVWMDVPDDLVAETDVIVDPRPMAAGEARQYIFTYELPWQRLPMAIRRPLFYPTAMLEVWAEQSLVFRGVGLREAGEEDLAGRLFTVYVSGDLAPHPQWQALLETTTGPAAAVSERERLGQRSDPLDIVRADPLRALWPVAAVLLLITVLAVRRAQHRKTTGVVVGVPGDGATAVEKATATDVAEGPSAPGEGTAGTGQRAVRGGSAAAIARLKEQIVQVDVAYHQGELDDATYNKRRNALRADLLRLMGRSKGTGEDGP